VGVVLKRAAVAHPEDESTVIQPETFTLHWEGPPQATPPAQAALGTREEREAAFLAEREQDFRELRRGEQGARLWDQIREEARRRGDAELWTRRLHAYWWVKLRSAGTAGDYARREDVNHATVRTWIRDVAKLAYQVGYRLHEDKLVLVGEAPAGLNRLRELVNRDAGTSEALAALHDAEPEFRGHDPYFHLNEGHILRSRGQLRGSDATLREGLTIAEAPRVRSLLWNARGQTLWDCVPESDHPLPDHLERAELAFRRAATLDATTYFPFVNLVHLAVDARDLKRAEYWIGELSAARKHMGETMQRELAKYLDGAEWSHSVEGNRFWRSGPAKWIERLVGGIVPLLVLAALFCAAPQQAETATPDDASQIVALSGCRGVGGRFMAAAGASLRSNRHGGLRRFGVGRRPGVAVARTAATLFCLLFVTSACQTAAPVRARPNPAARLVAERQLDTSIVDGIRLYESREYDLAARKFQQAAAQAQSLGDDGRRTDATTSECMAWLRARRLGELGDCSRRLEPMQRRQGRSEPGVNTLIAFGAIAAKRPLPSLAIPNSVRSLVQRSAQESRR
jgi:hypothetical protein